MGQGRGHSPWRLPALEVCLGAKFKALLYHPVASHHPHPVLAPSTAVRSVVGRRELGSELRRPRPAPEVRVFGGNKWGMRCCKARHGLLKGRRDLGWRLEQCRAGWEAIWAEGAAKLGPEWAAHAGCGQRGGHRPRERAPGARGSC